MSTLHSVLRWFLRITDPSITFWSQCISYHHGRLAYRISTVDLACGPRDFLTTWKPAPINSAVLWHVNNPWPYNAVRTHRHWHYLIYIPKRTNSFACYIYSVNLNLFYIYICLLLILKITSSTIISYSISLSAQLQSNHSKWMDPLIALFSFNKDSMIPVC